MATKTIGLFTDQGTDAAAPLDAISVFGEREIDAMYHRWELVFSKNTYGTHAIDQAVMIARNDLPKALRSLKTLFRRNKDMIHILASLVLQNGGKLVAQRGALEQARMVAGVNIMRLDNGNFQLTCVYPYENENTPHPSHARPVGPSPAPPPPPSSSPIGSRSILP